jgi:hypothetical protein
MGLIDRDDGWRMPDWLWQEIEPLLPSPLGTHRRRIPNCEGRSKRRTLVGRNGQHWDGSLVACLTSFQCPAAGLS